MIAIVVEPRISGRKANRVIARLGFNRTHRVEARGYSGGIWVLWKEEVVLIMVITSHDQFIHLRVWIDGNPFWLTAIYGSPNDTLRRALQLNLEVLASLIQGPWILTGDFNALLSATEREGRRKVTSAKLKDFQDCVENNQLIDLGFAGPVFTWHRGSLKQRLDWALCNEFWLEKFEATTVYHLPFLGSDHRPLFICLKALRPRFRKESRFHFQTAWMAHENFPKFVRHSWNANSDWCSSLQGFSQNLQEWNNSEFGNIFKRKRRLLARIAGIQNYLDKRPSSFLSHLDLELRSELDSVLAQEEMFWF
ncbi:hypothetical protein Tsubulata_001108 [Turnera subulata]|uniref:Endonuclease/exonuclease/phosphatase domain-containing protein n=1 Tax=Turnera subulata TaxID=218843 RepID=A0A9Q0JGI4_9ROSI|nr:hypothetical protein Tsubulata_001108 [Turnera subulata]